MRIPFKDRIEAGRLLGAKILSDCPPRPGEKVLVLGLPRGGIPVAAEIAAALDAPLDVFVVRKLGVPGHEELAMGAVASGGLIVLNESIIESLGIQDSEVDQTVGRELAEVARRESAYRDELQPLDVFGKILYIIDDGVATGSTMLAAARALRRARPTRLVVAVPVAPADALPTLRREADEVVCLATPEPFRGVGAWYRDFTQTSDSDVRKILGIHTARSPLKEPYESLNGRHPT